MRLSTLRRHWNALGRQDPLWAILTSPEKKGHRWAVEEFLETGRAEIAAVLESLEQYGIRVARSRALDFGCGAGRLTRALRSHFDEVIGIDIAASMIDTARRMHEDVSGLEFRLNTSTRLESIPTESVDFVYTRLVLQHIHPRYIPVYLAEFARVLRDGGVLVFQLPSAEIAPVEGGGLKQLLPLRVVAWLRRVRAAGRFPRMEVHGLPCTDVERHLASLGLRVQAVTPDAVHGAQTPGFRYHAVKTAAS